MKHKRAEDVLYNVKNYTENVEKCIEQYRVPKSQVIAQKRKLLHRKRRKTQKTVTVTKYTFQTGKKKICIYRKKNGSNCNLHLP